MKLPDLTVNEWLEAERCLDVFTRPPGSKTRKEYAAEKGVSTSVAGVRLRKMVESGTLEAIQASAPWGGRLMYYVPTKKEVHRGTAAVSSRSRRPSKRPMNLF